MVRRLWVLNLRLVLPRVTLVLCVLALGAALALLPLKWAAGLLAGSAALLLALVRPQYLLVLLALAVPFGSMWQVSLGPFNAGASELVILLLAMSWLARMIAARRIVVPRAPLFLPLLLFLGAAFLSTFPTTSLELSAKELIKWVEILIICIFMAHSVDADRGRWVVWALLAAAGAEASVGVVQFLRRAGPEGFVLFGRFMRAHGHFAQPNPFAGYLGLTAPMAYALTLEAAAQWRSRAGGVQMVFRPLLVRVAPCAFYAVTFVLMATAAVMSWSRGGWIGLAAALLLVTVLRSRTAWLRAGAVGLLVVCLLAIGGTQYLPTALVQRFADFFPYLGGVDVTAVEVTDANWAVIERMAHWRAALNMVEEHPLLGVGIGNYPVVYPQYALGRWQDPLGHAHNYYLNIAAEAGLVGLFAYLVLLTACFALACRVVRRLSSDALDLAGSALGGDIGFWRAVALGALGVLVHLSVHSLFDNLYVHSMNVQLGLVLGLLGVAERSVDAHRD